METESFLFTNNISHSSVVTDIRVNSYFSGASIFDVGLAQSVLNIQQSFEINKTACNTQRMNFDHDVIECDVSKKLVLNDKESDVMVATYPCKKYSAIADIHGTRTGDALFLHYFRHVAIRQPEIYALENVPGMRKFPVVMEAMEKLPNYYVTVFCPIKAETWLPQRRDRLILIGSKKPFSWRPPECKSAVTLKEIIEPDPEVNIPQCVYNRMKGKYRDKPIISDPDKGDLAPTCVAHYEKDQSTRLLKDSRFPMGVRILPHPPFSIMRHPTKTCDNLRHIKELRRF